MIETLSDKARRNGIVGIQHLNTIHSIDGIRAEYQVLMGCSVYYFKTKLTVTRRLHNTFTALNKNNRANNYYKNNNFFDGYHKLVFV